MINELSNKTISKNDVSPFMRQYLEIKEEYSDCIILYRLGDFYEMFYEDAIEVSKLLSLTLTGRNDGTGSRAPMCGIPAHAADTYINKLVANDKKVAICEQLTEPTKGKMIERDVIRVITKGTITDNTVLDGNKNNFICSVNMENDGSIGLCWLDITTGDMYAKHIDSGDSLSKLNDTLLKIKPSEVICNSVMASKSNSLTGCEIGIIPTFELFYDWAYTDDKAKNIIQSQFNVSSLDNLDISKYPTCMRACGAIFEFILQTQKKTLSIIRKINIERDSNYMYLDSVARRNLELVETMKDRKTKGSLLWVLDNTETAMGGRMLRRWVESPLNNLSAINDRLDSVEELTLSTIQRASLKEVLSGIGDLERLFGKVSNGTINPKDCVAIKIALRSFPNVKSLIKNVSSKNLVSIYNKIENFDDVVELLDKAFDENRRSDLPNIKDGGYISAGFNTQLDELRNIKNNAKNIIARMEIDERELTGIKTLKIAFNNVFGYFVEIPKSQINNLPLNRYERKQTLANTERYTFDELKEMEKQVLSSDDDAKALEEKLFNDIKAVLQDNMDKALNSARQIAFLDCYLSLSECAVSNKYSKPSFNDEKKIEIVGGRHPVIEKFKRDSAFIANDTNLDNDENKIMIITGPNMAGKSTYLRQVALIVLMAHIGSFVPATKADIALTDRIFTRIGASDDLAQGQSTFMIEMLEVSNILNNATNNSLLILDEVGRGTSTHDGLSIAWSLMEYLSSNNIGKVLFSTHYHELTELEGKLKGVKNYQIAVKEFNNTIIFLRKIMRGGAQKSFGIEVGAMAGLPQAVIDRAKLILHNLERSDTNKVSIIENVQEVETSKSNKCNCKVCDKLEKTQIDLVSPLEAFSLLCELKNINEGE